MCRHTAEPQPSLSITCQPAGRQPHGLSLSRAEKEEEADDFIAPLIRRHVSRMHRRRPLASAAEFISAFLTSAWFVFCCCFFSLVLDRVYHGMISHYLSHEPSMIPHTIATSSSEFLAPLTCFCWCFLSTKIK